MFKMQKDLTIVGVAALGVMGIVLMTALKRHRHHTGTYERVGKNIDERLRASKDALRAATAHLQSAFEKIGARKA